MLLSLSSAMRSKSARAATSSGAAAVTPPASTTPTPAASVGVHTPTVASRRDVVGETPDGQSKPPPPSAATTAATTTSATKKQRSIHDFFGRGRTPTPTAATPPPTKRPLASSASLASVAGSSLSDSQEGIKKRIDYDDASSLDDGDDDDDVSLSQQSEAPARTPSTTTPRAASISVVKPKRIDFGGVCPSSQRSEPDGEPASSQYAGYGGFSAYGNGMFSQDELDFCTPADQPVVHMSHPTTPSPIKKRPRHEVHEDVQNLTQDMTLMDVRHAHAPLPSFSSSDSNDMLLATPQRVLGLPTAAAPKQRKQSASLGGGGLFGTTPKPAPPPASESFTNPFAPLPAVDSRKRRKVRQSFPPTFGSSSLTVPYSRYLSEFIEQELLGSGAFSKVFKVVKKIDGWTYAIKKSKRHLRGRADTERALREVQALAALSDSRHIVRYFDAWIEDELLYIQLENCSSCSLQSLVDAHSPLHIPEETLCKILCHLAQALQDMHAKQMVHLDVKLPNVLVAPGEIYKLGDLGTVALADGSMDITEGDNRYLSRELLEGSRANLKAGDVFALGATVYELALGTTLPSNGEEWQKIRDGDLTLFRQYTNSLQHLIASMMHPDPLQRPSAEEILQHEVVRPYHEPRH